MAEVWEILNRRKQGEFLEIGVGADEAGDAGGEFESVEVDEQTDRMLSSFL